MTQVSFCKWAQSHMIVDMTDDNELFAQVPDQTGEWHKVSIDESGTVPVPTHCTCRAHKNAGTCFHVQIVSRFYNRIYKSNIAKAEAKQEQKQEAQSAVREAQLIVKRSSIELAAQKRAGSLPRNQGFSILRR